MHCCLWHGVRLPKCSQCSPSTDLEGYIQESGRDGRDGETCESTIMYHQSDKAHTTKVMVEYCENNSSCRRYELFKNFDDYVCYHYLPVTDLPVTAVISAAKHVNVMIVNVSYNWFVDT